MTRRELGEKYFSQGYNCAQAVALTFSDVIGLDENKISMLVSPFGGGFGRMREVCGAVSGMMLVLGAVEGNDLNTTNETKLTLYSTVQALMKEFADKNGSYVCRELLALPEKTSDPKPQERTASYYAKRPCGMLVGDACEILENYFARTRG